MREKATALVESNKFQAFIMTIIVINSVTLGIQTMDLPPEIEQGLMLFDNVCLAIYIVEAILKFVAYRFRYFRDGWNVFDFTIIVLSLIPTWLLPIPAQIARILRVFRAFKAFRLVSAFRSMRVVVEAIIRSIPGVISTAILMFVIFYIYAVIGTVAFADVFPDHFGNLAASLYTLFQVMTLESWSEGVSRPVMETYSWASVYFVTFVIISAFIMINVVVGIVVGTIDESQQALKEELEEMKRKDNPKKASVDVELAEIKTHLVELEKLLGKELEKEAADKAAAKAETEIEAMDETKTDIKTEAKG